MSELVLLVDDHARTLKMIGGVLERAGYAVRCAASGEEALKAIEQEWPSLVLLDIRLPGIDGIETLVRLRSVSARLGCPLQVIAMTASLTKEERVRVEAAGFDAFLDKPCSINTLREVVRRRLEDAAS